MVSSCGGAGSGMVSVELCHMYGQHLQVLAIGVREHRRRVWRSAATDVAGRTLIMSGSITGSGGSTRVRLNSAHKEGRYMLQELQR